MNRLMIGLFAACAVLSAVAAEFYVNADPNVGNDDYDGKAAVWDSGHGHGPIRTLANITNLVTATTRASQVGDTVYVAEGDYNFGSDATGKYRAELPAGTRLIGVGDKNKVRIFGSATDETHTQQDGAMRCLNIGANVLIKNLTLCNGRYFAASTAGGCSKGNADSYLVGCVVSNNYASYRGGAFASGNFIRCLFVKNSAAAASTCTGLNLTGGKAWNCVFIGDAGNSYHTYGATLYNCTMIGGKSPRYSGSSGRNGYNLLLSVTDDTGNEITLWHSLMSCKLATSKPSVLEEGSKANVGEAVLAVDENYVPVKGVNIGIDKGSSSNYEDNYPTSALVADQKSLDFNGNPRIRGEAIDVGACEADPDERLLSITDAQTALVVTGAAKGETILRRGETNTFTLARNYSTLKLCTGILVNGEFFSFTGENADATYEYTYGYGDPTASLVIEAVYAEHNDWYVALDGDDANDGYTKYRAKRLIESAMTNDLVTAGDTVHVAPGVYKDKPFGLSGYTTNRVTIAANVGLVADGPRGATVIEGLKADDSDASIRCVGFADGNTTGYVRNFTLRNGSTRVTGTYADYGGGIYGGAAIDCIITNCSARRGGGAYNAKLIRCRIAGCSNIGSTNKSGPASYNCSAYDSYIEGAQTDSGVICNCYLTSQLIRTTGKVIVVNSYVGDSLPKTAFATNCLYVSAASEADLYHCTKVTGSLPLDDDYRPATKDSPLVDGGELQYRLYPAGFGDEMDKDFAGGQRVYNGKIDIGCGEYDWRGDYKTTLGAKRVSVVEASSGVTNAVDAVVVDAGGKLVLDYVVKADGLASIDVVNMGEGTVLVKVGEKAIEPVGNTYSFAVAIGSNPIEITYAGSGSAKVQNPKAPGPGVLLIVR